MRIKLQLVGIAGLLLVGLALDGAAAGEAIEFVGPTPNRFVPDGERMMLDPGKFNMVGDVSKLSGTVIALATGCWWHAEECFGLNPGEAPIAPAAQTAERATGPTTTGAASATPPNWRSR
jgi:hypothetical protein